MSLRPQRGFVLEAWMVWTALGAIAMAAATIAVQVYLHHRDTENFKAGQADVQGKWDRQKLVDADTARKTTEAVGRALLLAENARVAAEAKAQEHKGKFEEAKREARRRGVALGGCSIEGQDPAPNQAAAGVAGGVTGPGIRQGAVGARDSGVRLTWEFVREFDGGWTGLDGQPVSSLASGGGGAESASAFAPYRLEDAVDVAGENAARCSRDRRELSTLITKVRAAGAAWDAINRPREPQ